MWKEQLPSDSSLPAAEVSRRIRNRAATETAVEYWQDWLKRMHDRWDGKQSLVLEPPAEYTTLPPTAYADTLPLPAGMNDAEVTHAGVFDT